MNAIIDITIENASMGDFDKAEEMAKSVLRNPEDWEFYQSGYDPKARRLDITLYSGGLHSDETW